MYSCNIDLDTSFKYHFHSVELYSKNLETLKHTSIETLRVNEILISGEGYILLQLY